MGKKYELLKDDTLVIGRTILYRIKALRNFGNVRAGDLGGYIKGEHNLSHEGDCWIGDGVRIYDSAKVEENARVNGSVNVYGSTRMCGNTKIHGTIKQGVKQ